MRVSIRADAVTLASLVTRTSVETVDVVPGETVVASFKATATRAFPGRRPTGDDDGKRRQRGERPG